MEPTVLEVIEMALSDKMRIVGAAPELVNAQKLISTLIHDKDHRSLREALAALAHNQWSNWMKWQFSKGQFIPEETAFGQKDTWLMPAWAVGNWRRQMATLYPDLSEEEKASNRAEADKMLFVVDLYWLRSRENK